MADEKKYEQKKRKEPRKVIIEEGQELTKNEFHDYFSHAKNSATWYCTNFSKTGKQIREKLYEKGYPEGEVIIEREGEKVPFNLVEETIGWLERVHLLDDRHYALRFAEGKLAMKQGRSRVQRDLFFKGIDEAIIEDVLEEVYADSGDELREFIERAYRQEEKRYGDQPYKLKQRLFQKAVAKGWGFDETGDAIAMLFEELEDED